MTQLIKYTHWISICTLILSWTALSYFGKPSPYELSLISSATSSLIIAFVVLTSTFTNRLVAASIILAFTIIFNIITIGNWWHFSFFQTFFNYEILAFGSDSDDALKAAPAFPYIKESLLLLTTTLTASFFVILTHRKKTFDRWRSAIPFALILIILSVSTYKHESSLEHYKRQNIVSLTPSLFSPIHAFLYNSNSLQTSFEDGLEAHMLFQNKTVSFEVKNTIDHTSSQKTDLNVLLVVMESLRSDHTGFWTNTNGYTPNLDKFARENITVTNFYANTNYTVKGETALWCGIFDHTVKPPIAKYTDNIKELDCLPNILKKKKNYDTYYFHANKSEFYSRKEYLPIVGFDQLHFYADKHPLNHENEKLGWGINDGIMFNYVLDTLESSDPTKPFFSSFMTITNHYPFLWEWDRPVPYETPEEMDIQQRMALGYKNSISYVDNHFGEFVDRFKHSKLAENTILIVTADHGVWVFDEKLDEAQANDRFFRVPFIIRHPDINVSKKLNIIASQIDVAPTLLKLLNVNPHEFDFVGGDMLSRKDGTGWAVSMKSGKTMVRLNNRLCMSFGEECNGLHQNCAAWVPEGIINAKDQSNLHCYTLNDAPLLSKSYKKVDAENNLLNESLNMISYHNQKVFNQSLLTIEDASDAPGLQVQKHTNGLRLTPSRHSSQKP